MSAERSFSIIMLRRRFSSKSPLVIGGCCDCEQLLVALLADETAVFLQRGNREDLLRELFVADADALALGLGQRGLLVDHLLEDLLIDAELPQQLLVDAAAVLLLVRLDLALVASLEVEALDVVAVDRRDHIVRRRADRRRVVSRKLGM